MQHSSDTRITTYCVAWSYICSLGLDIRARVVLPIGWTTSDPFPEQSVSERSKVKTFAWAVALLGVVAVAPAHGQQAAQPDLATMLTGSQRAKVTREELQNTLSSIEAQLGSGGYSAALRSGKQAEAERIRERLRDGDLRVGDIVALSVVGNEELSKVYTVTSDRSIMLPAGIEISVKGVLRSEMQDYMTKQLAQYLRSPVVRVETGIRLQLNGAVGKNGFFSAPAGQLLSDFLMVSGG